METLRHFAESGSDVSRPVYGFYGYLRKEDKACCDGIFNAVGSGLIFRQEAHAGGHIYTCPERFGMCVFVEWTILGALARAAHLAQHTYLGGLLTDFVSSVVPNDGAMQPKVIAVGKGDDVRNWRKSGRIVCSETAIRIEDAIGKSIPWRAEDYEIRAKLIDKEFFEACDEAMRHGKGDITDSLSELGFNELWPRALRLSRIKNRFAETEGILSGSS